MFVSKVRGSVRKRSRKIATLLPNKNGIFVSLVTTILVNKKLLYVAVKNKFNYAYSQEFPYRTNHILECEFYLLEHLDCCLIVYQPYRPLLTFVQDVGPDDQLLTLAWRVVNDSLRTDVCLLYPPYQIAIGESRAQSYSNKKKTIPSHQKILINLSSLDRMSANSLRDIAKGSKDLVRGAQH